MNYKQWVSALTLESAALALIARGGTALETLIGFLALHAAASVLVVVVIWRLLPSAYRRPRHWVWTFLFSLNFFVPVIGLAVSFIAVVAGALFPRLLKPRAFSLVASPEYTATRGLGLTRLREPEYTATRGLGLTRLREPKLPPSVRAEALMVVGSDATPTSGTVLRGLLTDPVDDIRLLAYGLLDRREKAISEQITRERDVLAAAEEIGDRGAARAAHHRIGELYWELVYQALAQGDMQRYALEQALLHLVQALDGSDADGARWLLIGRIRLWRGELQAARVALKLAFALGRPRHHVLPYLAELSFLQRRYDEVRKLMSELGAQPAQAPLSAMQQFWTAHA